MTHDFMVSEFITKFEASRDPDLWVSLVVEEAKEVNEAVSNLLKELADFCYVTIGAHLVGTPDGHAENHPEAEQVKTAIKWLTAMELAFDSKIDDAFALVHQSNMSKLGVDGKPIRREDGKILKGPNYAPPDLTSLVMG